MESNQIMTTGHAMMATSLDGFIAREDHTLDWLIKQETEGEDHGFDAFEASVDIIVMGSNSFNTILGFDEWPYKKPVLVLSQSLCEDDIPDALSDKVEISRLDPFSLMKILDRRGFKRAYIDGGSIIQSFLRAGLINDLRITVIPILIGKGVRLFGSLKDDVDLEVKTVEEFPSGLVSIHYTVNR